MIPLMVQGNKPQGISDMMQRLVQEQRDLIADLESRSKKLSDLVVTERFIVLSAVGETSRAIFAPSSEIVIGGNSPAYGGGFTTRLALNVSPENRGLPIHTLIFEGFSGVRSGDHILAQIPRYEERVVNLLFNSNPYNNTRNFYLDRAFRPTETAIELSIHSSDDTVILRTDRSIDYSFYK